MILTTRKPVSVGEMLQAEFMEPRALTQSNLAGLTTLPRKHINELCNDRRSVTADTALILARLFGNTADFWLNVQRRSDIWEALHSPERRARIERAQPLPPSAPRCTCATLSQLVVGEKLRQPLSRKLRKSM